MVAVVVVVFVVVWVVVAVVLVLVVWVVGAVLVVVVVVSTKFPSSTHEELNIQPETWLQRHLFALPDQHFYVLVLLSIPY